MKRPKVLEVITDSIPSELLKVPHWIGWKGAEVNGKFTKVPYMLAQKKKASVADPATWTDADTMIFELRQNNGHLDGVGWVLTENDEFIMIDFDKCRDPNTGKIDPKVERMLLKTYTEVSPSGTGLRQIAKGKKPGTRCKKGNFEIYDCNRYMTVTGHCQDFAHLPHTVEECQKEIDTLYTNIFGNDVSGDQTVINQLLASEKISALWDGNWQGDYPSQSEADQALISHITRFTGVDAVAIDRIFRQSGLMRPKWDEQRGAQTYGMRTITKALKSPPAPKKRYVQPVGYTCAELMTQELPEPVYVVPGLLPAGYAVIGGKPKSGKSIAALNLCVSVACGTKALGWFDMHKNGPVMYLALEDTARRLKTRLELMLGETQPPDNLHLYTQWPRMGRGGIEELEKKIVEVEPVLVVIDTMARFKSPKKANESGYDHDYDVGARIKTLADKYGIGIKLIHHVRKMVSEDRMDDFSGTYGVTAPADTLMILARSGKSDGELHISGRDIEEEQYALSFDKQYLSWNVYGTLDEVMSGETQQKIFDALVEAGAAVTPKQVAETTELSAQLVRTTLHRMLKAGTIKRAGYGKYTHKTIYDL